MASPSLIAKKIGIYAPYTWDEPTYMACTVFDQATRAGIPAAWLSSQMHSENVHHRYDHTVESGKKRLFSFWSQDKSHLVWFDVQKKHLIEAKKQGKHNTLVVLWHRLRKEDLELLPLFDKLVCPHLPAYLSLKNQPGLLPSFIPWAPGLGKSLPSPGPGNRFYVPLDTATAVAEGQTVLQGCRLLLDASADSRVTLAITKLSSVGRTIGKMCSMYGDRLRVLKRPDFLQRVTAYSTHDWTFIPNVCENSGMVAKESLAFGKPIIAMETHPNRQLVRDHAYNGKLIPCDSSPTWLGAPKARINAADLSEVLRETVQLSPEDYAEWVSKMSPNVLEWETACADGWNRLWGLG